MVNYNLTWVNQTETLYDVFYSVNYMTNGFLGVMILLVVWFGTMVVFKGSFDTLTSLIATNFITTIVGLLLWMLGFIAWWVAVIPLIFLLFSIGVEFFSG